MRNDELTGGRHVFAESDTERLVRRVGRMFQENWPELGRPLAWTPGSAPMLLFQEREHIAVRVDGTGQEDVVYVDVDICPTETRLAVLPFAGLLKQLGGRWRWMTPEQSNPPSIRTYIKLASADVGLLQESLLLGQINALRQWCEAVCPLAQKTLFDETALLQAYKPYEKTLTPLLPWPRPDYLIPDAVLDWAESAYDFLSSGIPVGVTGETPVERRLALTLLGERCLLEGSSLGRLALTGIDPQKLLVLAGQAPGFIVVPAGALEMNTNPYERGDVIRNLLQSLSNGSNACLFEGAYGEMQTLFHGGQGANNDPLSPVVCRIPEMPLNALVAYALWDTAKQQRLSLPVDMELTVSKLSDVLSERPSSARKMLVPVVRRVLRKGPSADFSEIAGFVDRLSGRTETFGAIGVRQRLARHAETQDRFQSGLTDPGFIKYLGERLFGQDEALLAYASRLQDEILTRPLYQPLSIALQGTPGTGKSESLALTAQWLGIPHVVIDVASIPDSYTGMAQLLGSGRGIVGSHQAGRLEQVAKHHLGAVVEIADIDHAAPAVRSALGDVFLQIMQTGEAQSSIGNMFSCANLILGFSLNLPGGKDEKAYQRVGFGNAPTLSDIRKDVQKEIKNMISGAFLSRLGEPVLFAPLSVEARISIVRSALADAALTMLKRIELSDVRVSVEYGAAEELVRSFDSSANTFGARGLVDLARGSIVKALLPLSNENHFRKTTSLRIISSNAEGIELIAETEEITEKPIVSSTDVITTKEE